MPAGAALADRKRLQAAGCSKNHSQGQHAKAVRRVGELPAKFIVRRYLTANQRVKSDSTRLAAAPSDTKLQPTRTSALRKTQFVTSTPAFTWWSAPFT